MSEIKIEGMDKLVKGLEKRTKLDPVKRIVRHYGSELQSEMQSKADFAKGYQTGETKRSIMLEIKDGGLTAEVGPTTDYSPYLEYGTRFMAAQPFVKPAEERIAPMFEKDIKTLIEG